MEKNEIIEQIPRHLADFVAEQPYDDYTAQDHALWRYVMRQNVRYLAGVAHSSYLAGLRDTGIGVERIPKTSEMNDILKKIGWAAVAVDGFIPPAAFMEFQAYNILVIAADIRPIDQIEYTPAPDIIHEAAGHAPIIADPEYAKYLRNFGEIGSKAFSSARDYELYEAIRLLSILKADPYSSKEEIADAERKLAEIESDMGEPSEMALIRNLHWWTVEYGLVGEVDSPEIYGAGLLSSIGESESCLKDDVKKLPYTVDAAYYNFDITTKQPQLFVTPDFKHLDKVLDEFAETMALRRGGEYGLQKAIESKNTATLELSSGLQISGTFVDYFNANREPAYFKSEGGTQLAYQNAQLEGRGKEYHAEGFGSPLGRLAKAPAPLETLSDGDLAAIGIETGKRVELEFHSGVVVNGLLKNILRRDGKILLMTFEDCSVKRANEVLFAPDWGVYDMAVGESIVSAYNGPADAAAFGLRYKAPGVKTHKIKHSEKAKKLFALYEEVRKIRENGEGFYKLPDIWREIKSEHPADWLLPLEILEEITRKEIHSSTAADIKMYLDGKASAGGEIARLINNGYKLF